MGPIELFSARRTFSSLASSHLISSLLLFAFFWMVAAASFSGSVGKWGLRDGAERFGIEKMLDQSAHKPFVYRQLAPMIAAAADRVIPDALKSRWTISQIKPENTFSKLKPPIEPKQRFRYLIVYYLSFFAFFFSLFILREIVLSLGGTSLAAVTAPTALLLAFPYLQTVGGYFYDSIELLFLSLAFLLVIKQKWILLILLAIPATLNKETFFFFIPTLYPLLRGRLSLRMSLTVMAVAVLASGVVNLLMKLALIGAPGGAAEFHLLANLGRYLSAGAYLGRETTYGVVGPHGAFFGSIAIALFIALRGWPDCPREIRAHILIAAALNVPLVLLFAATGELRNLSLMFVGFAVLIAFALQKEGRLEKIEAMTAREKQLP